MRIGRYEKSTRAWRAPPGVYARGRKVYTQVRAGYREDVCVNSLVPAGTKVRTQIFPGTILVHPYVFFKNSTSKKARDNSFQNFSSFHVFLQV